MKEISTSFALMMLATALAASSGVILFTLSLQGQIKASAQARVKGEQARNQDQSIAQSHALAQTTAPARASLEEILHTDILSIATMLTDAGKDAGVALEVSNAQQETVPTLKGNTFALQAIGFTVQGDGSFAKLMDAAALLEALPLAVSIVHLDMIRTSSERDSHGSLSWHMDARVRVLVAATTSP